MRARRSDRRVKFLRSLALVSGLSGAAASACGSSARVATPTPAPIASASTAEATRNGPEPKPDVDPGAACRCSWDTDANAAPRVCKRGETAFDGRRCVATGRQPDIVEGPLPPPDLAVSRRARRGRPSRQRSL